MAYLQQLIPTAERTSAAQSCNNYVYMRSLKAYDMLSYECNGHVLEIGSGSGYGLPYISKSADIVISIDKSQQIPLETLNQLGNVVFVKHTLPCMRCFPSDHFDSIVCYQFIEHIAEDKSFLSEIHRVLKPGGKLYISTPNAKMTLTRNPWHVREYTCKEFNTLLSELGLKPEKDLGVFGNEKVMSYYEQNRKNLERLRKYDILKIEERSNSILWKWAYDGLNHMNRIALKYRRDSVNDDISIEDFTIAKANDQALDLLYICRKD